MKKLKRSATKTCANQSMLDLSASQEKPKLVQVLKWRSAMLERQVFYLLDET